MRPASCAQPRTDVPPQWKVLITDEESRKLIDNVVKEDDILDSNITSMFCCLLRPRQAHSCQTSSASRTGARPSPTPMPCTSSPRNRI